MPCGWDRALAQVVAEEKDRRIRSKQITRQLGEKN
jgi:hypothetical protein